MCKIQYEETEGICSKNGTLNYEKAKEKMGVVVQHDMFTVGYL